MNITPEEWTAERLQALNQCFQNAHPSQLLQWGIREFASGMTMGTGFGPSGVVLIHMLSRLSSDITIFYLDTDLLFPETYALRDELTTRLGVQFTVVHSGLSLDAQAVQYGDKLWDHQPNLCCQLRKVDPLRHFLTDKQAWVTGIRRDQSRTRQDAQLIEWSTANQVVKINPLVNWAETSVWDYLREHNLPYNVLHDQGYPSLGCIHCTRAIKPGEDIRAGRWSNHEKIECGLHIENGQVKRVKLYTEFMEHDT